MVIRDAVTYPISVEFDRIVEKVIGRYAGILRRIVTTSSASFAGSRGSRRISSRSASKAARDVSGVSQRVRAGIAPKSSVESDGRAQACDLFDRERQAFLSTTARQQVQQLSRLLQ